MVRFWNPIKAVYPRWRGEHAPCNLCAADSAGLSPLARGTPLRVAKFHTKRRFIPAGAGNTLVVRFWNPIKAVYPRWRGEHAPCNLCAADSAGLSPLARGTPIIPAGIERLSRFIPAGAGNTTGKNPPTATGAVYPRWRGEHAARYRQPRINPRFIPAGAGNTALFWLFSATSAVYPRWRGEHGAIN